MVGKEPDHSSDRCRHPYQYYGIPGAISDNGDAEAYTIDTNSITTIELMKLVEMLWVKFHLQEFVIFMVNIKVHKTKDVLETWKSLKVRLIFKVTFNDTDTYFSLLKWEYKKLILERLNKGVKMGMQSLIMHGIRRID